MLPNMTDTERRERNIAICGFALGHVNEAPFGDPAWEKWGINRLHTVHPGPYDAYFNIHDLEQYHGEDAEHLAYLKNFDGPVYLRPQDIGKYDVPNAVPFPADELVKKFGRYFNNTVSWLIAYAIEQHPTRMGVYGVDMAQDALLNAEYAQQRPSCEYFLGLAVGLGIELVIPNGSDLLKTTHLYGFEDPDPWVQKMLNRHQEVGQRKEEAKQQLGQLQAQAQQLTNGINQLDGAMQDVQFWLRNWRPLDLGQAQVSSEAKETDHAGTPSDNLD